MHTSPTPAPSSLFSGGVYFRVSAERWASPNPRIALDAKSKHSSGQRQTENNPKIQRTKCVCRCATLRVTMTTWEPALPAPHDCLRRWKPFCFWKKKKRGREREWESKENDTHNHWNQRKFDAAVDILATRHCVIWHICTELYWTGATNTLLVFYLLLADEQEGIRDNQSDHASSTPVLTNQNGGKKISLKISATCLLAQWATFKMGRQS